MLKIALVAAELLLAVALLAGCAGSSRSEPTPTIDVRAAAVPYASLAARMTHSSFSVLYAGEVGGSEGDLLWRQDGTVLRWDFFYKQIDAPPGVSSAVRREAEPAGACAEYFDSPKEASVVCAPGGVNFEFNDTFITTYQLLADQMQYAGRSEIAGRGASCFSDELDAIGASARVCLADDGLPLSFDVKFGLNEASVHAIGINPPPLATDSLMTLPWTHPTGLMPVKVQTSQLALPPIERLQAYIRGEKFSLP